MLVPRLSDIHGNEQADKLAVYASSSIVTGPEPYTVGFEITLLKP